MFWKGLKRAGGFRQPAGFFRSARFRQVCCERGGGLVSGLAVSGNGERAVLWNRVRLYQKIPFVLKYFMKEDISVQAEEMVGLCMALDPVCSVSGGFCREENWG